MNEVDFFVSMLLEKRDANSANIFTEKVSQMQDTINRDFLIFLAIWLRIPIFSYSAQVILRKVYPFRVPTEAIIKSLSMVKQVVKKHSRLNNNNVINSLACSFRSIDTPDAFVPILEFGDPFIVESFVKGKEEVISRKFQIIQCFNSLDFESQYAVAPILAKYFEAFVPDLISYIEESPREKRGELENILFNILSYPDIFPLKIISFINLATCFSSGILSFNGIAFSGFTSYCLSHDINISLKPFNHPMFPIEMMNAIQQYNNGFMIITISKICSLKQDEVIPLPTLSFIAKNLNGKQAVFVVKLLLKQKEGVEKYCSALYQAKVEPLSSIVASAFFITLQNKNDLIALGTILSILVCSQKIFFKFHFCSKLFDYALDPLTKNLAIVFADSTENSSSTFSAMLSNIIKYMLSQSNKLSEIQNEEEMLLILYAVAKSEFVTSKIGKKRFTSAVNSLSSTFSGNPMLDENDEFPAELKEFAKSIESKAQIKAFLIEAAKTKTPVIFNPKDVEKAIENESTLQRPQVPVANIRTSSMGSGLHTTVPSINIKGLAKLRFNSDSEEETQSAQFPIFKRKLSV